MAARDWRMIRAFAGRFLHRSEFGRKDEAPDARAPDALNLSSTDEFPNLAAYVARGEARPAYKRAFDAQLAVNASKPATG
jgi:hypothetical protein